MDKTETPVWDTETGEPTKTMASKSPPEAPVAKGMKASVGERVLIGVILTVVIAFAIGGIVGIFRPRVWDSRDDNANVGEVMWRGRDDDWRQGEDRFSNDGSRQGDDSLFFSNDDWRWNDDGHYTNVGETIVDSPFEIEDLFSSLNATEPYVSIEDLRKDIEVLAKTFANTIILEEANKYQRNKFDFRTSFPETSPPTSEFTEETTSFLETPPVVDIAASVATARTRSFEKVDDFDTYQREAGVVSEDHVKSDGEHVFFGTGNSIKVWDIEGKLFETTTIKSVYTRTDEWDLAHDRDRHNMNDVSIVALHMNKEESKLTVISLDFYSANTAVGPIIEHTSATQVTIFSIDGGSLTEISHTYIDGIHVNSHAVGNNVHVVTRTLLSTSAFIDEHLYRKNFDDANRTQNTPSMTNEEYVAVATRRAEEVMPEFVDKVIDLVTEGDEINLSRVVGFRNSVNDYRSVTQVSSFDISNVSDVDDIELHASKSLSFQAGSEEYYFATDEWIWISHLKYGWGPSKMEYFEDTLLLGFRLDGASSTFAAVGSVPGHLLNEFSIDFVKEDDKEYVRVAVTEFLFNDFFVDEPFRWGQTAEPTSEDESESRTLNQIIILEVPKVEDDSQKINTLEQLGSISVGKKHEFITAVRFFDNISYVVTFEQTDPFYVLDLSNPEEPKVLGEFEVTGFSEFMHPIKEDNSMLLTVGQDADETGMITGFQISIFNSTDPTDPKLVDRLVIGNENGETYSASTRDEKSFRYIQLDEGGILIIPMNSHNWDSGLNFDGFAVFDIDLNASESLIKREILINHENDNGCYCYPSIWLPPRSFVFDGNLMTLKNQNVVSTDLVSPEHETKWTHSFAQDCCNT